MDGSDPEIMAYILPVDLDNGKGETAGDFLMEQSLQLKEQSSATSDSRAPSGGDESGWKMEIA